MDFSVDVTVRSVSGDSFVLGNKAVQLTITRDTSYVSVCCIVHAAQSISCSIYNKKIIFFDQLNILNIVRTRTGPEPRFRFRFSNLGEPNL